MRRRAVVGLLTGLVTSMVAASGASAGDPEPGAKPGAASRSVVLPARFLSARTTAKDLAAGASGVVMWRHLKVASDGSAWFDPAISVTNEPPADQAEFGGAPPTLKRVDANAYDVDLTDCAALWCVTLVDATSAKPPAGLVRIRRFTRGNDAPSPTMPACFLGVRLWSLAPGQVGYVSAPRVCVDDIGQGWIDFAWTVRLEPFVDASGPAAAVTASDRDVVKVDVTGTTHRWMPQEYPKIVPVKADLDRNGHRNNPLTVTSFTVGGKSAARLPAELMCLQVRDLKPGAVGYVEAADVRVDPRGIAWIYEKTRVRATPTKDAWGFGAVGVKGVDASGCAIDLSACTFRWTLCDYTGLQFPDLTEEGGVWRGMKWTKVVHVADGAQDLGAELSARRRAKSIWEIPSGGTAFVSCRYLYVDPTFHGFLGGWVPVADEAFADELGPAVALALGPDGGSCVADVSACTHRWGTVATTPKFEPASPGATTGPRFTNVRVTEFVVGAADDAKPPKGGK